MKIEKSLVAEPGPRMASMIRETLPCKGLLQVLCVVCAACLASLGGISAQKRRGPGWRTQWGCVGPGCSSRRGRGSGMGGGHLLCQELTARATWGRRGRGRCLVGIGDRGGRLVSNVFLHLWTMLLEGS